ncbi:MAG: hypothetical protein ABFR97_07815 [Thermodesulfobacteriota bacterium]
MVCRLFFPLLLILALPAPGWGYNEQIMNLNQAISASGSAQETARYHLYRSRAWQRSGDERAALADLSAASQLDPCAEYYYERAQYLHKLQRDEEALADLASALDLNRHFSPALQLRSEVYFDQKEYPLAMVDASSILHSDSRNPQALAMVDQCWIAASPRERILLRASLPVVRPAKGQKKTRRLARRVKAKPKASKKRRKKKAKKACGPTRRRS